MIAAAKAGDSAKLADAQARWVKNADQIAAVLHSVNPRFWKLGAMKAEMHKHLDLTTQEAVARLQSNWTAFDACLRGPNLAEQEREIRALLGSTRFLAP